MLPLPVPVVYLELLILVLAVLPLGCTLLRGLEFASRRRLPITPPERVLVAFFATGALLFVVASLPLALFSYATVLVLLGAGVLGYGILAIRESGVGIRVTLGFLRTPVGAILTLGSLGLLALEVVGGQVLLPNGVDGTVYSLFVNVLILHHGVTSTLSPFATTGILYPQGAPVWMSLPVLLFGWPIVSAPVELPPLFLSFTVVAAFCLGERLKPRIGLSTPWAGLLFAGFFGLLASWPRLYVAGSYDFIFSLPMFLVTLGFLEAYTHRPSRPWPEVLALGTWLGALCVISLAIGTALLLLTIAYVGLSTWHRPDRSWRAEATRVASVVVIPLAFLARSFVGLAMWFDYPGHVLTQTGSPPYAPLATTVIYSGWATQLDPFSPWKPKVSPIPLLFLVIEILLVAGIVICGLALSSAKDRLGLSPLDRFSQWVIVGIATLVLEISIFLLGVSADPSISGIQAFVNVWESSFLLFILYSLVAIIPLVVALGRVLPVGVGGGATVATTRRNASRRAGGRVRVMLTLVLVVPLVAGSVGTIAYVPTYLHATIAAEANATTADVLALEWAGDHLPSCSQVLVAPGSVAQFLPEYAQVHLVFPVYPSPTNRSYNYLVTNLTDGVYDTGTRTALVELGISEIFVTGATTNSYPPFRAAPLRASPDFAVLFSDQDAAIFEFLAGVQASDCAPT
jgi:hypothetical protein